MVIFNHLIFRENVSCQTLYSPIPSGALTMLVWTLYFILEKKIIAIFQPSLPISSLPMTLFSDLLQI